MHISHQVQQFNNALTHLNNSVTSGKLASSASRTVCQNILDEDPSDSICHAPHHTPVSTSGHVNLPPHNGNAQGLVGLPVHLNQSLGAPEFVGGRLHLILK